MTSWGWSDPVAAPETTVRICLRGDLVADKEQAEQALIANRQRNPAPDIGDADAVFQAEHAERVQRLEDECEAASVTFRFRALSRRDHSDLLAAHPPTDAQRAELAEVGMTALADSETFPPALVAASCIEPPGVTLEDATRAFEGWAAGPWERLWRACTAANQGAADPGPKSAIASAVLRGSGLSSD